MSTTPPASKAGLAASFTNGGNQNQRGVQTMKVMEPINQPHAENEFANDEGGGGRQRTHDTDPFSTSLHRNVSNQSTIDSGMSRNSHLDMNDPNIRRMFGLASSGSAERQRRLRLLMDQCETVKFPFKKRLILANLNLSHEEIPVDQICSHRLGSALYKLSLAGNRLGSIPDDLIVKLTGLRALDFSQCDLHSIPEKWDLPSLKKLNLSHNRIQSCLTESAFRGLPELQHLDLYGNKMTKMSLPSPCLRTKLEYLDVGYNHLTAIPDGIANLPSLKTLKCMNNAIEIIPAVICEMDLRVLDVSSNPLVQPPLETCERGLHSMRRYYHCLKIEEMAGPDFQQITENTQSTQSTQNKSIFKKIKYEKSRVKMRKKKDKMAFPSSLCRAGMFRTVSEPGPGLRHSTTESPAPASVDLGSTLPPFVANQETPPIRSVSFSLSKGGQPVKGRHTSDSSSDTRDSLLRTELIPTKQAPLQESEYYSGDSDASDSEHTSTERQLVGLNKAEKMADEITVNDTLKVIFVGMALSGKTSIIKRLIEGKDAKIPQMDERTIGVDIYEWDPKSASGFSDGSLMTQIPVDGELESRIKGNVDVKFSVWDFAGQHVYHATHELFYSSQSLYVLVWDMGANNADTNKRRRSVNEVEQGAFKLTYDSSDEEDDFFDSGQETRRAMRALEQDIDEKLQFWIDCIQSSAPGAAILPVASFDDYFSNGIGNDEATMRCKVMRERLEKHEERRVKSMKQRLKEYDSKFGASSELSVRLRKLLFPFNRPKIIFGSDGQSVVRVSSTKFSGFDNLSERIVNIATGRERGGWAHPIFRGHLGARIPRMRLEVRDAVRSMRDRFKVVEWNCFLSELEKRGIDNAADVSDALHFLANIGELSYFGDVAIPMEESRHPLDKKSSSLYEDRALEFDDEEYSSAGPFHPQNIDQHDPSVSLGLSEFIFLNPRWLVAAVACILRHDLTTEIYEVRRALRNVDHLEGNESLSMGEGSQDIELKTDVNYPVITARDACLLWQNKRFTKKAAERALQYSNNRSVSPYDFLERLLVRFGVFVPIDLSIKTSLGGRDCSRSSEYEDYYTAVSSDNGAEAAQTPKFFFLPSLLGPGDPNISDIWTFKTAESWKTTICHSILFPDGVPPGLMERMTASILSDLYTHPSPASNLDESAKRGIDFVTNSTLPQPQTDSIGQLRIKETLCWRSAFFLKLGSETANNSGGVANESIVEIFATLVDQDSQLCVASDSMGVGMRRLIFSGKGQAGDMGSKIWKGGYMRVLKKAVKHVINEYSGLEIERQAVCPQCLAKKPIGQASIWEHSTITSLRARGEQVIRCRYGHMNDVRLICGTSDEHRQALSAETQTSVGETDLPVSDLLKAVVIVGIWDENAQQIVRAGSGFIVDKKRGFIVTAGHTLMDRETWREVKGKIVIGVVPNNSSRSDPIAVYRYFARIVVKDPSINDAGLCKLDACVLQITTRMENDVLESGKEIGEQPETLLMNNPGAMKKENFNELKVSQKFELDEAVRILGFNQGGEGLIGPGEELNRCADFARGYVVMKFANSDNEYSEQTNRKFQPRSEIVVICPTIGGHSGGPCVNQQGEVIGILSRADPADRQRCYLVPTSEWLSLVKVAKKSLSSARRGRTSIEHMVPVPESKGTHTGLSST
ncbi:hypothetical protein ACHAXR_010718 [Thalassiosira sp. AJA248-18]